MSSDKEVIATLESRVAYLEFIIDKLYDCMGPAVDDVFEMIDEQWAEENDNSLEGY